MVPHRVEIHFTDLTKVIGGIRSTVTWDLDLADGELVEAELAFFARTKMAMSGAWVNIPKNMMAAA